MIEAPPPSWHNEKSVLLGIEASLAQRCTTNGSTKLTSRKSGRERTDISGNTQQERETETMRGMSEQGDLPVFFCLLMNSPIVLAALAMLLVYDCQ